MLEIEYLKKKVNQKEVEKTLRQKEAEEKFPVSSLLLPSQCYFTFFLLFLLFSVHEA